MPPPLQVLPKGCRHLLSLTDNATALWGEGRQWHLERDRAAHGIREHGLHRTAVVTVQQPWHGMRRVYRLQTDVHDGRVVHQALHTSSMQA